MYAATLAAQTRTLGPEHRDTLTTAMQHAGASLNRGRHAEAEAAYVALCKEVERLKWEQLQALSAARTHG